MKSAEEVIRRHKRHSVSKRDQAEDGAAAASAEGAMPMDDVLNQDFDIQDYVRPGVTEAEILEMKASFDLMDHVGQGVLHLEDLIDEMENLGTDKLEQEPLMVAIRACRRKGNTVDFAGFMDAISPLLIASEPTQESLRRAWRLLDESRKGSINIEDVGSAVRKFGLDLSAEELNDMVSFSDKNGSGEITFDEFYQILNRQH
eukprot:gb/GFBE01081587.1/.p1 GENE.gb/GFBE01081587.1/~~gb/GFBE01081587.1/.p1  ORF type:complete len:202 (+),score=69.16 gb/GFBE01081587.1/:1-606(+)